MLQQPPLLLLADDWAAEPWVQVAYGATIGVAALWLAADTFARWRRRAAHLTPVATAPARAAARPAFLTTDKEARAEALERGDAYEAHLREREAESRRAAEAAAAPGPARRLAGGISLFMSLFTLASMVAGAVWQVSWIGTVLDRYTTSERLVAVLQAHPVAFVVAVTVIGYHVFQFFAHRKWQPAA